MCDEAVRNQHDNNGHEEENKVQKYRVCLHPTLARPFLPTKAPPGWVLGVFGEHGDWYGDDEREKPADDDGFVRVFQCLPATGVQGTADGKVTLEGDGHQGKTADTHRHT